MSLKIDTKEKFYELAWTAPSFTANMTAGQDKMLSELLKNAPFNVVLNMEAVAEVDKEATEWLSTWQQRFYEQNHSFVICQVQPVVEALWDRWELLELLNITPTLSEAWDIVQMEEIERELMEGFE
ncbi:MAG TPA: STAS domain-containing protein [Phnomibacter sp.]|nr:STAS domain-containing protein [Phnomibacter sp.]